MKTNLIKVKGIYINAKCEKCNKEFCEFAFKLSNKQTIIYRRCENNQQIYDIPKLLKQLNQDEEERNR